MNLVVPGRKHSSSGTNRMLIDRNTVDESWGINTFNTSNLQYHPWGNFYKAYLLWKNPHKFTCLPFSFFFLRLKKSTVFLSNSTGILPLAQWLGKNMPWSVFYARKESLRWKFWGCQLNNDAISFQLPLTWNLAKSAIVRSTISRVLDTTIDFLLKRANQCLCLPLFCSRYTVCDLLW